MGIKSEITYEEMDGEWRVVIHDMIFLSFQTKEHAEMFKAIAYPIIYQHAVGVGMIGDLDTILSNN
jgi:hypothetical protein